MEALELVIDPAWGVGLLLSMVRVACFVVASPILGSSWPATGRLAGVVAVSTFMARPVPDVAEVAPLVVAAATNAAVGVAMGFLSGVLIHLFTVAGALIDLSGGLALAQVFDPTAGFMSSVYDKMFRQVALALFMVVGGLHVLVRGLVDSVAVVPLDGRISLDASLAEAATHSVGQLMYAGAELALPVLSSLLIAEVALGLAGRFAPQANVMLLGLPAKLLITMTLVGSVMLTLPDTVRGVVTDSSSTLVDVIRSLAF